MLEGRVDLFLAVRQGDPGLDAFQTGAFAAGAAIAFATRAGLQARRAVIETLSLSGAADLSIAWLFQRRFALLSGVAGAIGAAAAMAVIAGLTALGGPGGLSPALPLTWSDLLLLSPCPLIAATVALVSAGLEARVALGGNRGAD